MCGGVEPLFLISTNIVIHTFKNLVMLDPDLVEEAMFSSLKKKKDREGGFF